MEEPGKLLEQCTKIAQFIAWLTRYTVLTETIANWTSSVSLKEDKWKKKLITYQWIHKFS